MVISDRALPDDIEALKRLVLARDVKLAEVHADLATTRADLIQSQSRESNAEALIAHLRLTIEKMRREIYGQRSERSARLLDQMELELEELEAAASEDELAAERADGRRARRLARSPARSRRASPSPKICRASGSSFPARPPAAAADRPGSPNSARTSPRRWRWCRGNGRCCNTSGRSSRAGHARRSARPRRRSMCCRAASPARAFSPWCCSRSTGNTSRSTGNRNATGGKASISACRRSPIRSAAAPRCCAPLYDLIRAHVLAGSRVHGDDTTVPVLAKGQTTTGRAWVYVRDDRPFGGPDPPAAVFHYSRDRTGEHPERHLDGYAGILQADAYAGFNRLYAADRRPGPLIEAACWSHARRKFFVLADIAAKARGKLPVIAPLAVEAVKRIDAIFAIERADQWPAVRRSGSPSAGNALLRSSATCNSGCGPSAPGCRGMPTWPRPWTTC